MSIDNQRATAPAGHSLQKRIQQILERDPPRAKSLCVTLLGDAIEPHGGGVWLSDLIELVTPLGINERLLRTSVFRLVAQDWLQSERHGRRSLYRLSPLGRELTQQASTRIYDGTPDQWADDWTLVVLPRFGNGGMAGRSELRRELIWAGFGAVAPGVFALPRRQDTVAYKVLNKLKMADQALVLSAKDWCQPPGLSLASLVGQCWDLTAVANQYRDFITCYGPLLNDIHPQIRPLQAYTVRALTLHAWRRIVLHDPQLPSQLLPPEWPGHGARELCANLYWRVFDLAEKHLDSVLGKDTAHYQRLDPYVYERFGGRRQNDALTA